MRVLIRLDDFTPNRNRERWREVGAILDDLRVRPLVAVVPEDRYFGSAPTTMEFWDSVRELQAKGWSIGMHGETHLVKPIPAGTRREISFATKSEFIGLTLEAQLAKLRRAWAIFLANDVRPVAFVAPNHGFDSTTVEALRLHGAMRLVSDGISWRISRSRGLIWLPQFDWKIPRLRFGFRTACLHPSTMSGSEMARFAREARAVRRSCIGVEDIDPDAVGTRGVVDLAFAKAFQLYMNMKLTVRRSILPSADKRLPGSRISHD